MNIDDKDLGMIALTVIAIFSLVFLGESAKEVVLAVVGAISGFVIGRKKF